MWTVSPGALRVTIEEPPSTGGPRGRDFPERQGTGRFFFWIFDKMREGNNVERAGQLVQCLTAEYMSERQRSEFNLVVASALDNPGHRDNEYVCVEDRVAFATYFGDSGSLNITLDDASNARATERECLEEREFRRMRAAERNSQARP